MTGTYAHHLTEDIYVLFFYEYNADDSGDYVTPNAGVTIDIVGAELHNQKTFIDVTNCIDELCSIRITDIEDKIQNQHT